ncbi:MAG: hypothetical protein V4533_10455 [Pseudomonadota bacterium]|jgi:hypothetical protein
MTRAPSILLFSTFALLASCGERPAHESAASLDSPSSEITAPGITPTAAPGVAFNYAYQFRLPALRIAKVQEDHAQVCEQLGLAKCRITGMRYTVRGEDRIEAMLAFKLAPEIARQFGKGGVAAVEKAEGMVVETEISGTDVSGTIASAKRNSDEIRQEIERLETQLAKGSLTATTRGDLIAQISNLRGERRDTDASRVSSEDALANTPMVFNYASGELIPGFDVRSPISEALQTAVSVLIGILSFLIVTVAFLGPIAIVVAATVLGWRKFSPVWRRWMDRAAPSGE